MGQHVEKTSRRRARRTGALAVASIGLGLVALVAAATGAQATPPGEDGDHKVMLCHATDSYTNPYVVIEVDYASVQFEGHDGHDGPVFAPSLPKHTKWGDIIPPIEDDGEEIYPGKNWDAGAGIWESNCELPFLPTTTTVAPTTTTTAAPTTTTTEAVAPTSVVAPTTQAVAPTSVVAPTTTAAKPKSLPVTGDSSGPLAALGLGLIMTGAAMLALRRRLA